VTAVAQGLAAAFADHIAVLVPGPSWEEGKESRKGEKKGLSRPLFQENAVERVLRGEGQSSV
jgi:hypothetical protein